MTGTALDVLRSNDRGDFTVPNGNLYPFQWLWDAAFIALGWSTVDRSRAWDELDAVVRGQWPDGMLPHVVYHHPSAKYFPDPDLWNVGRTPATSGITQPPVLASVVLRLLEDAGADDVAAARARKLWPALVAAQRWMHTARDPQSTGLVCSYHPWETGMDNSPPWDEPMAAVPLDNLVAYQRKDTAVVDGQQRPTSRDYDGYVAIIGELRELDYDPAALWEHCSFKVADVATNAIAARAAADLVRLGRTLGEDTTDLERQAERSARGLQQLWHEDREAFLSRDLRTGRTLGPATSASFLPLWSDAVTEEQIDRLCDQLRAWRATAGALVPSTDPAGDAYDPVRYWRGPVWVNVNWMIAEGLRRHDRVELAERIATDTAEIIRRSGMYEYFDPRDGTGLGAADFSWTAALARYWLGFD